MRPAQIRERCTRSCAESRMVSTCGAFDVPRGVWFVSRRGHDIVRSSFSDPERYPRPFDDMRTRRRAFTLVEVLVVIAIIALLIGILVPALSEARQSGKLTVCRAHLGQLGAAIVIYADQNRELIPRGPTCAEPFDFVCADYATNQLWIGAENEHHPSQPTGIGVLAESHVKNKDVYFCAADDANNAEEELPRIGTELDAYGSYTYRQLDELPPGGGRGKLSSLGANLVGEVRVPVEALVMDTNSLGPGPFRHTNHDARKVNVLYRDRAVQTFDNKEGTFSIPAEVFKNPLDIFTRLDQILINADYGYRHDPRGAPDTEEPP